MRHAIFILFIALVFTACKKDEVEPTIFEGFETKSFTSEHAPTIINHTWATYDPAHKSKNRLYFRGDGNLYIKYNYDHNSDYQYAGTFNISGDYIEASNYGNFYIDTIISNHSVAMETRQHLSSADTTIKVSFFRDQEIVK